MSDEKTPRPGIRGAQEVTTEGHGTSAVHGAGLTSEIASLEGGEFGKSGQVNAIERPSVDQFASAVYDFTGRGWKVIPLHWITEHGLCSCRPTPYMPPCPHGSGKHPIEEKWTGKGIQSQEDAVHHWVRDRSDPDSGITANVGILTGAASGVWVLDVDPRNGGDASLAGLEEEFGPLPATYRVRTGSGGWHLYFALDGLTIRNDNDGKLRVGLDVKGEGGYVVAPPSVSGVGPYTVEDARKPVPAPGWLVQLLVSAGKATRGLHRSETPSRDRTGALQPASGTDGDPYDWDTATTPGAVPIGSQEGWLAGAAQSARGMGLSDRAGRMMVRRVADAFTNDPAREPWTHDDADKKWEWAKAHYPDGRAALTDEQQAFVERVTKAWAAEADPRAEWIQDPETAREFVREVAKGRARQLAEAVREEEERVPLKWTRFADRATRPPMEWLLEGLAPRTGVWVEFGPEGVGKTFVNVDLTYSVANGLDSWMGFPIRRHGPVVVILMEGAEGYPGRERAWIETHPGTSGENVITVESQPVDLGSEAFARDFVREVREAGMAPVLVIVDTQGLALNGRDENSRTDLRKAYRLCKQIAADLTCCVKLITHPGHQHRDRPAGASSQRQDADAVTRVETGTVEVQKVKEGARGAKRYFRITPVGELAVAHHLADSSPMAQSLMIARREADEIVRTVRDLQGDRGTSKTKVYERVGGTKANVLRHIDLLITDGRIRVEGNGSQLRLFTDERTE